MADLKISQLPEVIVPDISDILPIVDAGLTKRVSINNLSNNLPITTFVRGASSGWGSGAPGASVAVAQYSFEPPYTGITDNLVNNTDNFPRWNTQIINTRPDTFEFFGSGTTGARVFIKEAGYYLIVSQIHYFDLWNNNRFSVNLFRAAGVSPAPMVRVFNLANRTFPSTTPNPPGQTVDSSSLFVATIPGYYTVGVFPTLNSPFPASTDTGASRMTFIKVLPL